MKLNLALSFIQHLLQKYEGGSIDSLREFSRDLEVDYIGLGFSKSHSAKQSKSHVRHAEEPHKDPPARVNLDPPEFRAESRESSPPPAPKWSAVTESIKVDPLDNMTQVVHQHPVVPDSAVGDGHRHHEASAHDKERARSKSSKKRPQLPTLELPSDATKTRLSEPEDYPVEGLPPASWVFHIEPTLSTNHLFHIGLDFSVAGVDYHGKLRVSEKQSEWVYYLKRSKEYHYVFPKDGRIHVFKQGQLVHTSQHHSFRGQCTYSGVSFENTSRNVVKANGQLYFINNRQQLCKMSAVAPFHEDIEKKAHDIICEDFIIDNKKIYVLSRWGDLLDLSTNRFTKLQLLMDLKDWCSLAKSGNCLLVSSWSKTRHENVFFMLDFDLQIIHSLIVSCASWNSPAMRLLPLATDSGHYVISSRAGRFVDLLAIVNNRLTLLDSVYATAGLKCSEILCIAQIETSILLGLGGKIRKLALKRPRTRD